MRCLAAILNSVPPLEADWQDTNHFELHDLTGEDFFWFSADEPGLDCDTERGQRFGKVLDLAASASEMMSISYDLAARLAVAEAFIKSGIYSGHSHDDALLACDLEQPSGVQEE
jgi:hypothetical protein